MILSVCVLLWNEADMQNALLQQHELSVECLTVATESQCKVGVSVIL